MNDFTELKELAEAANAVTGDVNVEIVLADENGTSQEEIDAVTAFLAATKPAVVLGLIADLAEANKRIFDLLSVAGVFSAVTERDTLKAECEGLRARTVIDKEAARWRMRELPPGVPGDRIACALFAAINEAKSNGADHG